MKIKLYVELDGSKKCKVVEFNRDFKNEDDAYDCPDVSDALEEFVQDSIASWLEIIRDTSDTTGWKLLFGQYSKEIQGVQYYIKRKERNGTPYYHVWCYSWGMFLCRLADAKRAAHRHAEESE